MTMSDIIHNIKLLNTSINSASISFRLRKINSNNDTVRSQSLISSTHIQIHMIIQYGTLATTRNNLVMFIISDSLQRLILNITT